MTLCCHILAQMLPGVCRWSTARHKLQGRHPVDILLAELAPKHSRAKYWKALQVRVRTSSRKSLDPGLKITLARACNGKQ